MVDIEAVQRFVSFVTGADHAGADGEFDPETAAYRKLVAVSDSRRPEIPLVAGLPVFEVVESRAAVQADVMAVETPGPGEAEPHLGAGGEQLVVAVGSFVRPPGAQRFEAYRPTVAQAEFGFEVGGECRPI